MQWLATVDPPRQVLLGCAHADLRAVPPDAVGLRVAGCLADADLSLPAQILASGAGAIEVVECPIRGEAVRRRAAQWREVLDGVAMVGLRPPRWWWPRRHGPTYLAPQDERESTAVTVSRRTLLGLGHSDRPVLDLDLDEAARGVQALRLLRAQGRARLDRVRAPEGDTAASQRTDTTPALTVPAPVPAGATPDALEAQPVDAVGLRLSVDGCVACGVCVLACPHDALVLKEEESTTVVRHHEDRCRADRACLRLCPALALTATAGLSLADLAEGPVHELARVHTAACRRCGARHPVGDGELCPTCSYRAAHPFGSTLPPGLAASAHVDQPRSVTAS